MLWPWLSPFVWFLFFPAVFLSARLGGLWPGLASTVLSAGIVWYCFIPPRLSWAVGDQANLYSVGLFLVMGYLISDAHERLQRAQLRSETRFEATFEQAAVGIALVSPDGRWLQVNRKLCDILGYSRAELLGLSFRDLTHPDDLDADLAHVERMLQGEARVYLDQIGIASHRMADLIDGILTLSRSTRTPLQYQSIDLSALAERQLHELAAIEPGRQVHWQVAEGLVAAGDPRMIEVVMQNLLGNAWKYTANSAAPEITVYSEQKTGEYRICVSDNGAGFDMAHAGKLFQPFQRLHRQEEFTGIGIGLATVQRIVQRHGGNIEASGVPTEGARFCFTLGEHKTAEIEDCNEQDDLVGGGQSPG